MMNELFKEIKLLLFVLISLVLYVLFIFFPEYVPVIQLKYAGILFCFFFSFLIEGKKRDTYMVRGALFFTVIADLFLLVLTGYVLIGVSVFIIVQLLYGIRLGLNYRTVNIRLLIFFLFQLIGIFVFENYELFFFVVLFYIANLVANVLIAFGRYKFNEIFAVGLLLFLLCDIFVGLNNASDYIMITKGSIWDVLLNLPIDLMWFFYFPSQVLITLSILTNKERRRLNNE